MSSRTWALAAVLALSAAATAAAQSGPAPSPPAAKAPIVYLFVSPCGEPFRATAAEGYPVRVWFKKADANGDGVVDRTEFENDAKAFFAVLDADKDGYVEGYEVSRYEHQILPEILYGSQGARLEQPHLWLAQYSGNGLDDVPVTESDGSRVNPPSQRVNPASMEGAAAYGLLGEPEPVRASDGNFDGRVSLKEFVAAADRRFNVLDKRHDGKLALDELPMTVQQQMAEQKPPRRRG
jgi:hypothetical protein